jgi:hypothetical protein
MAKQPAQKRSNAELVAYAEQWLAAFRAQREDPGEQDINLDPEMLEAILVDYLAMKEAALRRKGRAPWRPHNNPLGEAVQAQMASGLSESEARQAVAQQTGETTKAVGQAHRRLMQRQNKLPSLHQK